MRDGSPMFREVGTGNARRDWAPVYASVGAHIFLVILLLHGRSPVFVAPSSVLRGASGSGVTAIYWVPDAGNPSLQAKAQLPPNVPRKLTWKAVERKPAKPTTPTPDSTQSQDQIASAAPARSA